MGGRRAARDLPLGRLTAGETRARRGPLLAQLSEPLREFLATETGSARLLLGATVAALVWANSPLSGSYESLWTTEMSVRVGDAVLAKDLRHWVDDGLMVFFVLVVGLEARRELTMGDLTDRRTVRVPVIASLAGMAVPAAIYLAINPAGAAAEGWGVVISSDTAFVLGALALVGPSPSTSLRVFLVALTVVDDIVAIAVIGLFYSHGIDAVALAVAVGCVLVILVLPRLDIRRGPAYFVLGLTLWIAMEESGLHPTIAGMAMGLLISAYPPRREEVEHAVVPGRGRSGSRLWPRSRARPSSASSERSRPTSASRPRSTRGSAG